MEIMEEEKIENRFANDERYLGKEIKI